MSNTWTCLLMRISSSWKHHILHIASKIRISIGIIARLRHFVPLNTLQPIYRSLIKPYLLRYKTWGLAGKTHRNVILRLQKLALRPMFFCDYKTHAIPLFISSKNAILVNIQLLINIIIIIIIIMKF